MAQRLGVPLSSRGQYEGWNEQSEAMFAAGTKKPVQTGRCTVSELCPHGRFLRESLIKAPAGASERHTGLRQ